jgi:hypothetical protein
MQFLASTKSAEDPAISSNWAGVIGTTRNVGRGNPVAQSSLDLPVRLRDNLEPKDSPYQTRKDLPLFGEAAERLKTP